MGTVIIRCNKFNCGTVNMGSIAAAIETPIHIQTATAAGKTLLETSKL